MRYNKILELYIWGTRLYARIIFVHNLSIHHLYCEIIITINTKNVFSLKKSNTLAYNYEIIALFIYLFLLLYLF